MKILPRSLALRCLMLIAPWNSEIFAATSNIWHVDLTFNEFEGQPGGFDDDTTPVTLQSRSGGSEAVRNYDILRSGTSGGQSVMIKGQDGTTDLTMQTHILEGNGNRWFRSEALKRRNTFLGDITVDSGRSKSGDFSVIAYEFTVSSALNLTSEDFAVRLSSANGLGEIYEWTFVTLSGFNDAPFDKSQLQQYHSTDYSNLSNSQFFNPDGTVKSGGVATTNELPAGKTISQFLAGKPTDDGQFVQTGWYAMDDRNVINLDGVETEYTNPGSGTSALLEKTVTGSDLGLTEGTRIEKFTVWFGFYDVALDTNGDGFTLTNSNQDAMITRLSLGESLPIPVPEPTTPLFLLAVTAGIIGRRRRN